MLPMGTARREEIFHHGETFIRRNDIAGSGASRNK